MGISDGRWVEVRGHGPEGGLRGLGTWVQMPAGHLAAHGHTRRAYSACDVPHSCQPQGQEDPWLVPLLGQPTAPVYPPQEAVRGPRPPPHCQRAGWWRGALPRREGAATLRIPASLRARLNFD